MSGEDQEESMKALSGHVTHATLKTKYRTEKLKQSRKKQKKGAFMGDKRRKLALAIITRKGNRHKNVVNSGRWE